VSQVPELLYSLPLSKDWVTQPLEIVNRQISVVGPLSNDMGQAQFYVVPNDRIFIVTSLSYLGNREVPGTSSFGFTFTTPSTVIVLGSTANGPALTLQGAVPISSVWMPQGTTVFAQASHANNSALTPNTSQWFLTGITIPRGSVSLS